MSHHEEHDAHDAHDDHASHGGVAIYVAVAVALLFLTGCSYLTHLPLWDAVIGDKLWVKRTWMMAVSCSKAMLVILFFMHLKWEANWKWVLTIPASLMSAFLVLMLVPDVGLRMRKASEQRLVYAADLPPAETKQADDHGGLKVAHPDDP
jgi:cytochrome c oxidase subunit 4